METLRLFSAAAMTILYLGFASCGDDTEKTPTGGNGQEISEQNLIGTWEEYWEKGWEKDSADPSINSEWDNEIPDEDKTTVTFKADHTGRGADSNDDSFIWRLEGNTLYIGYGPDDMEAMTIKRLTASELVFEDIYKEGTLDFYELLTYRKK